MKSGGQQPSGTFEDVQDVTAHISAAAIKALRTSPVELVSAPGPGRIIRAKHLFVEFRFRSVPFVTAGSPLRLGTAADNAYWSLSQDVSLGGVTESRVWSAGLTFEKSLSALENQPLVLTAEQDELVGPIAEAEIAEGGSGYAPGDTGIIVGVTPAAQGQYLITDTGDEGLVEDPLALTLSQGSFFVSDDPIETQPYGGNGDGELALRVTKINPQGDGEMWITVDYDVMALSGREGQ